MKGPSHNDAPLGTNTLSIVIKYASHDGSDENLFVKRHGMIKKEKTAET